MASSRQYKSDPEMGKPEVRQVMMPSAPLGMSDGVSDSKGRSGQPIPVLCPPPTEP